MIGQIFFVGGLGFGLIGILPVDGVNHGEDQLLLWGLGIINQILLQLAFLTGHQAERKVILLFGELCDGGSSGLAVAFRRIREIAEEGIDLVDILTPESHFEGFILTRLLHIVVEIEADGQNKSGDGQRHDHGNVRVLLTGIFVGGHFLMFGLLESFVIGVDVGDFVISITHLVVLFLSHLFLVFLGWFRLFTDGDSISLRMVFHLSSL